MSSVVAFRAKKRRRRRRRLNPPGRLRRARAVLLVVVVGRRAARASAPAASILVCRRVGAGAATKRRARSAAPAAAPSAGGAPRDPEAELPQHQQAHARLAHVPLPAAAEAHVAEERVGEPPGRLAQTILSRGYALMLPESRGGFAPYDSSSRTMSRQVVSSTSGEPATTPTKAVIPSTAASTAAPWARSHAAMPCCRPAKGRGEEREELPPAATKPTFGSAPAASSAAMAGSPSLHR